MTTWPEHFRREERLERALRDLGHSAPRALARQLACHPFRAAYGVELLRRVGAPADATVKAALRLLQTWGEPTPPLDAIRLQHLHDSHACCLHGVILINPSSPLYRDPPLLAALIHHEMFHARNLDASEAEVCVASRRFCERHDIEPDRFLRYGDPHHENPDV